MYSKYINNEKTFLNDLFNNCNFLIKKPEIQNLKTYKIQIKYSYRVLIAERCLLDLCKNDLIGKVTEKELKEVLRRYNSVSSLIKFGTESIKIFNSQNQDSIGKISIKDKETGIIISGFSLAYLANILIISGSNNYKSKHIDNINKKDNFLMLCNIYNNYIIDPALTEPYKIKDKESFISFMIRLNFEQMTLQFEPVQLISKNILMFLNIINKIKPIKFNNLSDIFKNENGISIYDYFRLSICVFAVMQKTGISTFNKNTFINADISPLKDVLNENSVNKFLNILSTDYKQFRDLDFKFNKNLDPIFTKDRFNTLNIYPIINPGVKTNNDDYIVPNIFIYIRKAFCGLFWWFDNYFAEKDKLKDFRDYFGKIFEEYIGIILKDVYKTCNVEPEIIYDKNKKFFDWIVEKNNKIYLFEAKSYQLALGSLQKGKLNDLEIDKIAGAIKQVFERIEDVKKYPELNRFNNKKIIPIIIFLDIPFVSSNIYHELIINRLTEYENNDTKNKLKGLKNFFPYLINSEEIELFENVSGFIEIEDVFSILKKDIKHSESFLSVLSKYSEEPLRNNFLYKTFNDFFNKILN